jgi:hypothetical protein
MGTKKKFDAVAESRKWRVATGKKLSKMSREERLQHLNEGVQEKLERLVKRHPPKTSRRRKSSAGT